MNTKDPSPTVTPAPIATGDRLVANIHDASNFVPFTSDGIASETETVLQLDTNSSPGVGFHVYRMAPGCVTTPHEHTADEHFLVLEGDITDNDGYRYQVGDLVLLKRGTEHFSTSKNGCTLAVFIGSPERNLSP